MGLTLLTLPWPPSVNHYWGRAPSGKWYVRQGGKKFLKEAQLRMKMSTVCYYPQGTLLSCYVEAYPPTDKRRDKDLDNIMKAIFDAMQRGGIFDDDKQIVKLYAVKGKPFKQGVVLVALTVWDQPQPELTEESLRAFSEESLRAFSCPTTSTAPPPQGD